MTAALPMGGQKITGMADPTVATDAATKNYIDTLVASFFSTGDVKFTLKTVGDSGWIMCDDGTIGSGSSGASTPSNSTQALFTLIFNNISDTYSPIFTSGGGATTRAAQVSASAAWAANCRISLTKMLGRALGIAGSGASLTARTLGQNLGTETNVIAAANLPSTPIAVTDSRTWRTLAYNGAGNNGTGLVNTNTSASGTNYNAVTQNGAGGVNLPVEAVGSAPTVTLGSGTALPGMPPMSYLNCMIKV
jgi:hypothetical protein